jgi:hypothetical protein
MRIVGARSPCTQLREVLEPPANTVEANPHKTRICQYLSVKHSIEFSENNDILS